MKRRDVIKLGAVAAGATAGVPGCGLPHMLGALRGEDGAAAFNAMLDEQLTRLERPGLLHELVKSETKQPLSAAAAAKIAEKDAQFRKLLGTLMISQGFRELPPETQLEPTVQARMWRHMDQISTSVFEVSDMLASLDQNERGHVHQAMRERPELAMTIGEALDARAAKVGMSDARRRQLRSMMAQSAFRLRHGDPGTIIDEYVDKIERMRASSERDGDAIDLAQKLGEREFWRYQHLLADAPGQPASGAPAAPPQPAPPQPAAQPNGPVQPQPALGPPGFTAPTALPPPPVQDKHHPGSGGLRTGAYLLGIGLLVGAVSAVIISVGSSAGILGLFGLTAAVIAVGIGLLTLLISALIYATSSDE